MSSLSIKSEDIRESFREFLQDYEKTKKHLIAKDVGELGKEGQSGINGERKGLKTVNNVQGKTCNECDELKCICTILPLRHLNIA